MKEENAHGRPSSIGDGGASWRLKALRRAEAQAAEEGADLENLVAERFGSLTALTEGLSGQRTAHREHSTCLIEVVQTETLISL